MIINENSNIDKVVDRCFTFIIGSISSNIDKLFFPEMNKETFINEDLTLIKNEIMDETEDIVKNVNRVFFYGMHTSQSSLKNSLRYIGRYVWNIIPSVSRFLTTGDFGETVSLLKIRDIIQNSDKNEIINYFKNYIELDADFESDDYGLSKNLYDNLLMMKSIKDRLPGGYALGYYMSYWIAYYYYKFLILELNIKIKNYNFDIKNNIKPDNKMQDTTSNTKVEINPIDIQKVNSSDIKNIKLNTQNPLKNKIKKISSRVKTFDPEYSERLLSRINL